MTQPFYWNVFPPSQKKKYIYTWSTNWTVQGCSQQLYSQQLTLANGPGGGGGNQSPTCDGVVRGMLLIDNKRPATDSGKTAALVKKPSTKNTPREVRASAAAGLGMDGRGRGGVLHGGCTLCLHQSWGHASTGTRQNPVTAYLRRVHVIVCEI